MHRAVSSRSAGIGGNIAVHFPRQPDFGRQARATRGAWTTSRSTYRSTLAETASTR
jgi:hypothetical protein